MFGSRSGCLIQNERLRRRIPMFPRTPTSSRRTYDSCDPLATAINVVKGIPRSLGASSRSPSLEKAGPGCHLWFDYCSPHGEGPQMARSVAFQSESLALIDDVLYSSISVHNYKHRLLGPNRLLDFEGCRANPGEVPLPCRLTFWALTCRPHLARDRKQTVVRSCAGPFRSFYILVLAFSLSWPVRSAKQHSRYNNSTFSEL